MSKELLVGLGVGVGQGVFGTAELRHPSCATLGTCILHFADFLFTKAKTKQILLVKNHRGGKREL
jgi:hypothetical protein